MTVMPFLVNINRLLYIYMPIYMPIYFFQFVAGFVVGYRQMDYFISS